MSLVANPEKTESWFMVTTKSNSLYLIKKDDFDDIREINKNLFGDNERIIQCVGENKCEMCVFYITRSTNVEQKNNPKYKLYVCSYDGNPKLLKGDDFFVGEGCKTEPNLIVFWKNEKINLMID